MLWLAKRVVFGDTFNSEIKKLKDLNLSEGLILGILALTVVFFGFYPNPIIQTVNVSVSNLINSYQMDLIYHLTAIK